MAGGLKLEISKRLRNRVATVEASPGVRDLRAHVDGRHRRQHACDQRRHAGTSLPPDFRPPLASGPLPPALRSPLASGPPPPAIDRATSAD